MQFLIGEKALIAGLAFPQNGDFVLAMRAQMAVQAVVGDVGLRAGEPAGEGRVPLQNLGPFFKPVNLAGGDFAPEFLGILLGAAVQIAVAFDALNMGSADEIVRGRIDGGMTHEGIVAEGGWRGEWRGLSDRARNRGIEIVDGSSARML